MFEIYQILKLFVIISFGIPFLIFGIYGAVILYYSKKSNIANRKIGKKLSKNYYPTISVITPTHNEESIITKKIENLTSSKYPKEKVEIIFVDDSDDSTPQKIEEYAKKYPFIRLIRFSERKGYSPSMIAGCKAANGEIIVFSDAGSFHDENTISNLVSHFQDGKIGAVTGNKIILNSDEKIGKSENLYLKIYKIMRSAEIEMDSTFWLNGEAAAVRKNLITDFEKCKATFDTGVALLTRKKGFKTIYDPHANFYDYTPKTHSGRVKQKTFRAANLIKILLQFKAMIFKPQYGKFGCFILPMYLAMLIVAPVAILTGLIFLITLTFFDFYFSSILWSLILVISVVLFTISKNLFFLFFELTYSLLKAIYQVFFTTKTHDMIDTVQSTRR